VSRLPRGSEITASSARCNVQAMVWGGTAHSVQFHAELDAATLSDWYEIEQCEAVLRSHIGSDADRIFDDLAAAEAELSLMREKLYRHWIASFKL
jgi:GMP synthase-like glutamine amidotransferase